MNRKKAFTAFLLLFIMIFVVSVRDVNAADSFKMDVYATKSISGGVYEIHTSITNNGSDFSGTLRIIVTNSNYNRVGYDIDISIPKGSVKEYTISVPVKDVMTAENVQGLILDKTHKTKYKDDFRGVFNSYSGFISTGILSDRPDDLSFMDMGGKKVGNDTQNKQSIKLIEVSAQDLDEELDNLQMLIIDDYDTSTLKKSTITKIENWTRNGGMLVLGTGSSAEKVISGFDSSFLDVEYTGDTLDNGEQTNDLFNYAFFEPGPSFYYGNYSALISTTASGCIAVIPYRLRDYKEDPDAANVTIPSYYNDILAARIEDTSDYSSNISIYDLKNMMSYMEKPANTSAPVLIIILIVYVVLVGPVIYLILKAMKKQEIIWYVIPCISLLFVGFVFILSFSVKVRGLILRSVSIVNLDTQSENAYIMGYNPRPREWNIKTKNTYKTANVIATATGFRDDGGVVGSVKMGGDNELSFYPSDSFDMGAFNYSAPALVDGRFDIDARVDANTFFNDDPTISGSSTNTSEATMIADHLAGTVTNNTGMNFDYVIVCLGYKYQLIEGLKNGESRDILLDSQVTYTYSSEIYEDLASKPYKANKYDDSARLSALALAYETIGNSMNNNISELLVIGVREQDSLTDEDEKSWMCCYSTVSELY